MSAKPSIVNQRFNVTSRIQSLELVSFNAEERKLPDPIDPKKVTFEIGVSVQVNEPGKLLTIVNPITIFSDETKKERLGSLQSKGEFVIENFAEITKDNGLPGQVIAIFVGVVISSSRGMLRILSKGTPFESAVVPIINPTALVEMLIAENKLKAGV